MKNFYENFCIAEKELILEKDYPRIATIDRGSHGKITMKGTLKELEKQIASLKSVLKIKDKDIKIRTARF